MAWKIQRSLQNLYAWKHFKSDFSQVYECKHCRQKNSAWMKNTICDFESHVDFTIIMLL